MFKQIVIEISITGEDITNQEMIEAVNACKRELLPVIRAISDKLPDRSFTDIEAFSPLDSRTLSREIK